jgi:2-methylcitrate dehydratase PrpD
MIEFRTFEFAASMTEPEPENSLSAKFSLPHAAAAQVVLGDGGIDAFTATALANPEIRALAKRVKVEDDAEMSKRTPGERPASVVVHLADGSTLHGERSLPHGDDEPVTDDVVLAKFTACSERTLEPAKALALRDRLWDISNVADVDELW